MTTTKQIAENYYWAIVMKTLIGVKGHATDLEARMRDATDYQLLDWADEMESISLENALRDYRLVRDQDGETDPDVVAQIAELIAAAQPAATASAVIVIPTLCGDAELTASGLKIDGVLYPFEIGRTAHGFRRYTCKLPSGGTFCLHDAGVRLLDDVLSRREQELMDEYAAYLSAQGLPECPAEDLLLGTLTQAQRDWVTDFVKRWEEMEYVRFG